MAIFSSRAVQALPDEPTDPPSGIRMEGYFTVDNCFEVWLGTNTAVTKLLKGPVINTNSDTVILGYSVTFDYTPGMYLYIIAWSDNETWQGLIGQFSVVGSADSDKVYTDDPAWRVYPTGMDFNIDKRKKLADQKYPKKEDIDLFLAADPIDSVGGPTKWQTPAIGPANIGSKQPFTFVADGIKPEAHWVWHNSHKDTRGSTSSDPLAGTYPNRPHVPFTSPGLTSPHFHENLNDEFLIFAIPLDKIKTTTTVPSSPPDLFAEHPFDDNKFALTPVEQSDLWSAGDPELNLDFLVAWMVANADQVSFDSHLVGMGIGVRVANGPKTSIDQEMVVSATDQTDNSTPNSSAPANAGIRYTDGRVYIFPGNEVMFVVKGFVSPLRATLKEEFTSDNKAVSLAELHTYDSQLPQDSQSRTQYNPLLSALRAMGQFEAMVDRIIAHIGEVFQTPDAIQAAHISTLMTNLAKLKLNAIGKINVSDAWWDIEVTYPSYRKIKDNQTFP